MSQPLSYTICDAAGEIRYVLERKAVKNINLRVRRDGAVYVSAAPCVSAEYVALFVRANIQYIRRSQQKFASLAATHPSQKRYISGETFYIAGRALRLKVIEGDKNSVSCDGIYILLQIRDCDNDVLRRQLMQKYLDNQYRELFNSVIDKVYPVFSKYGIAFPRLRLRKMKTRWGTCAPKKGVITLNTSLAQASRDCIEYVAVHEFCHFIYPNHSKLFYSLLTALLPDWKQRKKILDEQFSPLLYV